MEETAEYTAEYLELQTRLGRGPNYEQQRSQQQVLAQLLWK